VDGIIAWLVNNVPQPFSGWILAVAQAIKAITDLILGAMFGAANAFMHQLMFVQGFLHWLGRHAQAVYNWARWLLLVKLPGLINYVLDTASRAVQYWFGRAIDFARGIVADLQRLTQSVIDWVWNQVQAFIRWAQHTIADIVSVLTWVRDQVYELLTDPAKLAEWLAGAMLAALGRYVVRNAGRLAQWAWPRFLPAVVQSARMAESILTQIF
jgi:hypothetical protein